MASLVSAAEKVRTITVAHSPDSDDAFMFYGLATDRVGLPGIKFEHTLCDIETLNRRALEGHYDVTAISFHAYPYLQEKYALLASGGSVGEGYGPMVVAARPMYVEEMKQQTIAVPGAMTTAYLALKLFNPGIATAVVPFDQIIPQVVAGEYAAGLIIHEGQITFASSGLHRVLDLGLWWRDMTGLPLPLGGNAIRRDLGEPLMRRVAQAIKSSIQYALDHREDALKYAMQFARELDRHQANQFVGMYVNQRTLDYGDDGRQAIQRLLDRGCRAGIIPIKPKLISWNSVLG
jgi:1,4-dihydroxy-6-naphthoate synthase